jgi:hypothetical protein
MAHNHHKIAQGREIEELSAQMTIRIEAHCALQQERQGEGKVDRDKPPLLWN